MRSVALLALLTAACTGAPKASTCSGPEACESSDTCPSLAICSDCACKPDPGSGSCETTAGCPLGTSCRDHTCKRTTCRSATDCESGEACHATFGTCVASDCTTRPCPAGLTCDVTRSTPACVTCRTPSDCPIDAPLCAPDGSCVACTGDGDCTSIPGKPVCSRGRVCGVCRQDRDCSPGQRCTDEGTCGVCASDADCPGSHCDKGTCASGPTDGEACGTGGLCGPGLRCTPGEVCRPRCDPLAPTCSQGRACALLREDGEVVLENGRPAGACMPFNRGGSSGEVCSSASSCEVDLYCLPDSASDGICRRPCDPAHPEVCGSLSCLPFPIGAGEESVYLCSSPSTYLRPCTADADCGNEAGCHPHVSGGKLALRCEFGGRGGPATACATAADCRSSLCLALGDDGICFGGCRADPDCAGGFCGPLDVVVSGVTATFSGCHPECTSDAACAGRGGACGVVEHDRALVGECRPATQGGTRLSGAPCKADGECRSGTCLLPAHLCAGACAHDEDCDPAAVCRTALASVLPGESAAGSLCWGPPCTHDADCGPGRSCTLEPDPASPLHRFRTSCLGSVGSYRVGRPCDNAAECASGYCFGPFPDARPVELEVCNNGVDDDGDGLADCDDPDCARTGRCMPGGQVCSKTNDLDQDHDGLFNCQDPDCRRTADCAEDTDCKNGGDDDGDGLVDCSDPSCAYSSDSCKPQRLKACFGACASDFDCAEGTVCQDVLLKTPGGDDLAVSGCVPP